MSFKLSPLSVTNAPCRCGYLEENASQLESPFKFNALLHEYYFEHQLQSGVVAKWIIHHCPMCGGVASNSLRDVDLVNVPEDEVRRLQGMIRTIKTVEDVEHALGKPDSDETIAPPFGIALNQPGTDDVENGPIRVLTYVHLSQTADVQFTAFSNRRVEGVICPKSRKSQLAT